MLITKHYPEEHYSTMFNPDTGFFARIEDPGHAEPFWSEHGPELLDVSITNWCDRACLMCYRNSSTRGQHMSVTAYEDILKQAARAGVMQIALGGGNPNQHPDFVRMLEITRRTYGIVPNYTTNGRGLSTAIVEASAKSCGAVAVSAYAPYDELWHGVTTLVSAGIKTSVHFVLDAQSIGTAIEWLQDPPPILKDVNAVVFLNYKPAGRQGEQALGLRNSDRLNEFFSLIEHAEHPFRVGFDSCMVSGVASRTSIDPSMYDACEAGRFSMFISEDLLMYPCSFLEGLVPGVSAKKHALTYAWRAAHTFCQFRELLQRERCPDCPSSAVCMGGCPVFEAVNLCPPKQGLAGINPRLNPMRRAPGPRRGS